ncbi:MAG TPA: hypothetical protein VJA94_22920 [Candidatus Angelobacter sp.]
MGFLASIGRALGPIALEHGSTMVRVWWKGRSKQADQFQQIANELDQLRQHAARVDSDLDALNNAFAARENKLRKWILALLIWNVVLTSGFVLAVVFLRR